MKSFNAGHSVSQGTYKAFQPEKINRDWQVADMSIIQMLSEADRCLGRLDMFSEYIPNIDLFIQMHVLKEAQNSSKIEGTKTNIEDALLPEIDIHPEQRLDWEEVQNYICAQNESIESLANLPLSTRLIKNAHKILLTGVRGRHKTPGEFRRSQNWIGGASIKDARFVPPVHTSIAELMGDLENFMHNTNIKLPDLLKSLLCTISSKPYTPSWTVMAAWGDSSSRSSSSKRAY